MNNDFQCLQQGNFQCWQPTASKSSQPTILITHTNLYRYLNDNHSAIDVGFAVVLSFLFVLSILGHRSHRKIVLRHQIEMLERLWQANSSKKTP